MATRHHTAPACAGERSAAPVRLVAPGGPVTRALQACDPIEAIRLGLEEFFANLGMVVDFDAPLADVIAAARIDGGR